MGRWGEGGGATGQGLRREDFAPRCPGSHAELGAELRDGRIGSARGPRMAEHALAWSIRRRGQSSLSLKQTSECRADLRVERPDGQAERACQRFGEEGGFLPLSLFRRRVLETRTPSAAPTVPATTIRMKRRISMAGYSVSAGGAASPVLLAHGRSGHIW